MLRVGLTGGLATGKSHVGTVLRDLGCFLVQADVLGHAVLEPDGEAYGAVVAAFGREILEENGERIDRRKLARQVFGDLAQLERLNALVHPPVIAREEALIREAAVRDPEGIAVVEAAILIETGSYKRFEKLILTVCSEAVQVRRAMKRDGASEQEVRARLARQMPLAEKRKFADYVIDTSGSKAETAEQVRAVYNELRSLRSKP
jgi:dephospho-CoA kinase